MRQDMLRVISSAKDITNAIILTHNIDFVFVQSVVISALRKCGSPSLTIFADAECATQTYQHQAPVLADLGRRYRVIPVGMRPGYRFHPKALLLSGPESATLLVGSGNLTFGGWRENGEVWTRYDSDNDGTRALAAFQGYLHEVLEMCPGSETLAAEVDEAFDPNTHRWPVRMDQPGVLLGRVGQGHSMLEQIRAVVDDAGVDELHVCAPYFDERAEALRNLAKEFGSPSTTLLVQSHRTNLLAAAATALDSSFVLKAATYQHRGRTSPDGDEHVREALLHAKFYAVRQADVVTVFSGSANCSRAALTVRGSAGNAELMTYTTMSKGEFEEAFLAELVVSEVEPLLAVEARDDKPPPPTVGFIHVMAARFEARLLRVAFQSDETTRLTHAEIDEHVLRPLDVGEGRATFMTGGCPRMVVLIGTNHDAEVRSQFHWIDDETALRASARGRSLAESIHSRVRGESWSVDAWTDVLSELLKHLQYMPRASSHRRSSAGVNGNDKSGPVEFQWDDVFSDTYRLSAETSLVQTLSFGLDGRIGGLRSMLLRWYGIALPEQEEAVPNRGDDSATPETRPGDDDGDSGDKVADLPKAISRPQLPPASHKERKRALKLVSQVASRLGEADFLSERHPEVLAADLKVAALLLRAALAEGWLTEQEFLDATLEIWLPLFFNAGGSKSTGWFEQRYLTASDQKEFAKSIRSVELAAALGCWALSMTAKATSVKHSLFDLASALGVARLPWLWQTGGNEGIAREIATMIAYTSQRDDLDWREVEHRWLTLIRRGYALGQLEKAIADVKTSDLRDRIKQVRIVPGELLWQKGAGFCVAIEDCARVKGKKAKVLVLQQGRGTKLYTGPFLMPVAGLLDKGVLDQSVLSPRARSELLTMVQEFRVGLFDVAHMDVHGAGRDTHRSGRYKPTATSRTGLLWSAFRRRNHVRRDADG